MKMGFPRWLIVASVVVASAILVGGGWLAATLFVSPEQLQANARPPEQSPLVAEVEVGDLVSTQTFPASVVYADSQQVPLSKSTGDALSIITHLPVSVGTSIPTGTLVAEVNGQPVYLFESIFPFYRDMEVGDEGRDVSVLQNGLVERGYLTTADGRFGAQTAAAVTRLYRDSGYEAPTRAASGAESAQTTGEAPPVDTLGSGLAATRKVVYVPLSSLAAAKQLPATLRSSPIAGDVVGDATTLTLDSSTAQIQVPLSDTSGIAVGDQVSVVVDGVEPFSGQVTSVAISPGETNTADTESSGEDSESALAVVAPADASVLTGDAVGRAASVILEQEVLATRSLLVPLSAIAVPPSGGIGAMMVQDADGTFRRVEVTVIAAYAGMAAITSADRSVSDGAMVLLG